MNIEDFLNSKNKFSFGPNCQINLKNRFYMYILSGYMRLYVGLYFGSREQDFKPTPEPLTILRC